MIDLRSDTVTKPTMGMLNAMVNAQVGDDVFGEDSTVNELEETVAKLFGHEAALFCASGTMANQIAVKAHTQPMDEIILDKTAHIYYYETAGFAFHSGVSVKLIDGNLGRINATQVLENIQPNFDWLPKTSLVCLENTSNKGGGSCYEL
jgi:threonine aldolase